MRGAPRRAPLALLAAARACAAAAAAVGAVPEVEQYHIYEVVLNGTVAGNPFADEVDATFVLGERSVTVPGFYAGGAQWRVRFSPAEVGVWAWATRAANPSLAGVSGSVRCVANTDPKVHGGVEVYDTYHFRFADGTPHMVLGYEADWLWALDLPGSVSPLHLDDFVAKVAGAGGFNHWLVNVYAKEASWARGVPSPPKVSPTSMTPWAATSVRNSAAVDCTPQSELDCKDEDLPSGHHAGVNDSAACCALCSARTDCVTWTVYPERADCYLKSGCSNPVAKSNCVSGGSTQPAAVNCTPQSELDCKDEDLPDGHHAGVSDSAACCALCSARADCVTWTVYPERADCFLKSGCSTPVAKSGCVSGGRTRPAAPTPAPPPPPGTDQSRMDLDFWAHWDDVVRTLAAHGAVAHVYVMVENKAVDWPARRSANDNLYWRYTLARLQAYWNVVFDLSKEANNLDDDYVIDRLNLTRRLNGHNRLITAHTGHEVYKKLCDFVTDQTHPGTNYGKYHQTIIDHRNLYQMPVVNAEFGYEAGPIKTYPPTNTPEEMRTLMWGLYMAGGYAAWYYSDAAWDVIQDTITIGYTYCKYLRAFWESVNEHVLAPHDDVVSGQNGATVYGRAAPCADYLAYAPSGGTFAVNTTGCAGPFTGRWYDPRTGQYYDEAGSFGGGVHSFTPPAAVAADAVLRLRRAGGARPHPV